MEVGKGSLQNFEKYRLEIRALHEENKDSEGNLNEETIISYNALILDIPESGMSEHHIARKDKLDSKICHEWFNVKSNIDLQFKFCDFTFYSEWSEAFHSVQ